MKVDLAVLIHLNHRFIPQRLNSPVHSHTLTGAMSSENETSSENPTSDGAPDTRDLQDMVLHLNFVPTWARKPATQNPYSRADAGPEREPRRDQAPRRDDRNRGRGPGMGGGGGGRGPRPDQGRGGRPAPRRDDRDRERQRPEAPPPWLPIEVAFIPEHERLGAVGRQLHASQRACPLRFAATLCANPPTAPRVSAEERLLQGISPARLAAELQRRGWIVVEP